MAMLGAAISVAIVATNHTAVIENSAMRGKRSEGIATSASGTRKNSGMPQSVLM
ncbi:hypothetical protein [Bradyrhizobium sp. USDA 4341]